MEESFIKELKIQNRVFDKTANKDSELYFSKNTLANYVYKNYLKINFNNFKFIFNDIQDIINDHNNHYPINQTLHTL